MARTAPGRLWQQAHDEHPNDVEARRARYLNLMREHGHLVPKSPGDDGNLPCGWPGPNDPYPLDEERKIEP